MKNQGEKSAAGGTDRISELPDKILHSILRRIRSPKKAAQTIALSRRWRGVWLSYPVVEFDGPEYSWDFERDTKKLKVFCDATIKRFSLNNLSKMEKLKISHTLDVGTVRSPAIEQLLDLASKKNAEEIVISVQSHKIELRLPLLANSKILRLRGVSLANLTFEDLPLSSLRFLSLMDVTFEHEQLFVDLISSSPLLETLILNSVGEFRKLRISNLTNLKTLDFTPHVQLEKIEIAGPALQNLYLGARERLSEVELTVPGLRDLEIVSSTLSSDKIGRMISKLESLKSLSLMDFRQDNKKLKLSCPNLEELELRALPQLEEIELDAGLCLTKFSLDYNHRLSSDKLKKCEIRNPSPACRWEIDFSMDLYAYVEDTHPWFVGFESFIGAFTQFQTVRVSCQNNMVTFRKKEVDHTISPHAIQHLMINTSNSLSGTDQNVLLDGLFWACRPKFFSIYHDKPWRQNYLEKENIRRTLPDSVCSKLLFQVFLSQHSGQPSTNEKGLNEHGNWRHQLKDVKIMTGDINRFIPFDKWCSVMKKKETLQILEGGNEEEPEEAIDVSEHVAAYFKNPNKVCFMLTWH